MVVSKKMPEVKTKYPEILQNLIDDGAHRNSGRHNT